MNGIDISTFLGRAACSLALAGTLMAQQFSFLFDTAPEPAPAPEAWVFMHEGPTGSGSFLGIGVAEINSERAKSLKLKEERGVEITRVQEDSPADKAGLKTGDVVLEFNGQRVVGTEQFVRLVRETPAGRTVDIVVSRDGALQTLKATTGSRKEAHPPIIPKVDWERFRKEMEHLREFKMPDVPKAYMSWRTSRLGVEVESLGSQLAEFFGVKGGVLVRSVMKGSAAEEAGIKAGDVIFKVGDENVSDPREVSEAVRSLRSKGTFPVTVMRDRKEVTLTVKMDAEGPAKREETPRGRTVGNRG